METTFINKTVTLQDILNAFHDFDAQYPDTNQYEGWLDKATYKYAVRHENKLYPPKHILSQASGIPTTEFGGGEQTNRVFRDLGFEVGNK